MDLNSEISKEDVFPKVCEPQADESRSLFIGVLFVAVHSILLGSYIFLSTDTFYRFFFGVDIENFFFVRQSGLFLFCLGLFYFVPLLDLKKYHFLVVVIIITKILAVGFLVSHTQYVPRPLMILLAAFIDASMAVYLSGLFIKNLRKF